MWICPNCKESIEDQFDSCWKCAGKEQQSRGHDEPASIYPVISFLTIIVCSFLIPMCWHSLHHGGGYFDVVGAMIGIVVSGISIGAFFRCPWRNWSAKLLTLLLLVPALYYGVFTVGSFSLHELGY